MKQTRKNRSHLSVVYPHYKLPCPNAAEPQYFIDRIVDGLLSIATGIGAATVLFFLALL